MDKNIETYIEFTKIIMSEPTLEEIRYLQLSKALTSTEENICEQIINNRSIIGNSQLELIFDKEELEKYSNLKYKKNEILAVILEFIKNRYKQENTELTSSALENASKDIFNNISIELINQHYLYLLEEKENNDLKELEDYCNLEIVEHLKERITLGVDEIDKASGGFISGKVSTIVDRNENAAHMVANHLAYSSITNNKNVIYFSFNKSRRDVLLELISRHSKDPKFKGSISYKELLSSFDEKLYLSVYDDIKYTLDNNLKLYEFDDFPYQNIQTMRKAFAISNNEFIEKTEKPVDLIVIDGLDKLRLDKARKTITSKNTVEYEYYLFLQDMASKFLGENVSIPIILTTKMTCTFRDISDSDTYVNINTLSDNVRCFSDVIVGVNLDNNLIKGNKLELSLFKSSTGNQIDWTLTKGEFDYSIIYPRLELDDEPYDDGVRAERFELEAERLKKENEEMGKEIINLNNKRFDIMTTNELPPLDDILKM